MMNRKLGINIDCTGYPKIPNGGDVLEYMKKIKAAGFDSIFATGFTMMGKVADVADSIGLGFEFLHAHFDNINTMWQEGDAYRNIYNKMQYAINAADSAGVPTVVMHLSSSWNPPEVSEVGLARFDSLVNLAKNKNINIAFENIRVTDNVKLIGERYADYKNVGFCYDMGHEHCYTIGVDWTEIFKDRIICTHIHDNMGIKEIGQPDTDMHLLPFDGNIDFADAMKRLNKYNPTCPLMLEILADRTPRYAEMPDEKFLALAYERAKKLAEM